MKMRRPIATGVVALAAVTAAATLSAASDTKAPRIVAAVMQDADQDFRADRLRLTYSERVHHVADRDGKYPFTVAGYRISSVARASGTTVVIALVEKPEADAAARPAVRYRPTAAAPVVDPNRNQAVIQLFRSTRPHGNRPAPPPPRHPRPADARRRPTATATGCSTPRIAGRPIR